MSFSMAPLLIHNEAVPAGARRALRAAQDAPAEWRVPMLEHAAKILHRETGLDCGDVRELVGLPETGGCG
jgi:hypothetical protein